MLGIHTGTCRVGGTLTVAGVVTTCGTLVRIPLVELTVVTTVLGNTCRTSVQAGTVTLITVSIATTVLALLGVEPGVVGASKDIVTNTLHGTSGTSRYTTTVLTSTR